MDKTILINNIYLIIKGLEAEDLEILEGIIEEYNVLCQEKYSIRQNNTVTI